MITPSTHNLKKIEKTLNVNAKGSTSFSRLKACKSNQRVPKENMPYGDS